MCIKTLIESQAFFFILKFSACVSKIIRSILTFNSFKMMHDISPATPHTTNSIFNELAVTARKHDGGHKLHNHMQELNAVLL